MRSCHGSGLLRFASLQGTQAANPFNSAFKILFYFLSNDFLSHRQFIFQGTDEHRIKALEWLFDMTLHLMLQKSPECLRGIVNPDGTIICCFMWVPATAAKLTPWELLKAGLWQLPFRFGYATMSRLVSLLNAMEATMGIVKDVDGNTCEDFVMLQRMVVLPSCQGKGVGSRALRAILKEHCATARLPIHLETQEEPNVRFYQRLGWEVSGEQDHFEDDHEYKFHSWQMVHPGTTPASS